MKQRDLTSAEAKEALLKDKEEKCCGNCCWFFSEDTDGWGFCAANKCTIGEFINCTDMCQDDFVSRQEMRHHMYVMLRIKYWYEGVHWHVLNPHEMHEAYSFAYKYMKVFSNL